MPMIVFPPTHPSTYAPQMPPEELEKMRHIERHIRKHQLKVGDAAEFVWWGWGLGRDTILLSRCQLSADTWLHL